MTLQTHILRTTSKARRKLVIKRKRVGSSWRRGDCNEISLKKVYSDAKRTLLEYGVYSMVISKKITSAVLR
jgi:hypothetical protein